MCESLLRQAPNGAIGPGLTTLATASATKLVVTLKPGVTFWDGKPVTPVDVYSLDRNTNPKLGGFYGASFDRVKSIKATRLQGELASVEAVILEKAYVQKGGQEVRDADRRDDVHRRVQVRRQGIIDSVYKGALLPRWQSNVGTFGYAKPVWIPDVQPTSVLVLNKSLTGAVASFAYRFAPWADRLGVTG